MAYMFNHMSWRDLEQFLSVAKKESVSELILDQIIIFYLHIAHFIKPCRDQVDL